MPKMALGGRIHDRHSVLDVHPSSALLLNAALSHLELAVVNVSSQAAVLKDSDSRALEEAIACLKNVLDRSKTHSCDGILADPCKVHIDKEISGLGCSSIAQPFSNHAALASHASTAPDSCEHCEDFEASYSAFSVKRFLQDSAVCAPLPIDTQLESVNQSSPDTTGGLFAERQLSGTSRTTRTSRVTRNEFLSEREVEMDKETTLQPWLRRLMDVFDQMDTDKTGAIDLKEWTTACTLAGLDAGIAEQLFRTVDTSNSEQIDRVTWLHMLRGVQHGECPQVIIDFSEALGKLQAKNGRIYKFLQTPSAPRCILRPDSSFRMSWDICMTVLLAYIAIQLPYSIGFPQSTSQYFNDLNETIDYAFMVDIVLNFRTAYEADFLVLDSWHIAKRYMRSWFLLDLLTCLPLEKITAGVLPNLQSARLLKIGKILKVFRLLKVAKFSGFLKESATYEYLEDGLSGKSFEMYLKLFRMFASLMIASHWMACLMSASGNSWQGLEDPLNVTYNEAIYWSLTTLTTVGYGDVSPAAYSERLCAMFSMVLGAGFYAYVVGNITATITSRDLNASAYHDRLEKIRAWLAFHTELPLSLRRRAKKYFQQHLMQKTAIEDCVILNDLSPALSHDICYFLAPEEVRANQLFKDMPLSCFSLITPILERTTTETGECIVSKGDLGVAMYIIQQGTAYFKDGHHYNKNPRHLEFTDPSARASSFNKSMLTLGAGGSFGEEIVLGMEEEHTYSIEAQTRIFMFEISKKDFLQTFASSPQLLQRMTNNFSNRGEDPDVAPTKVGNARGRSSVLRSPDRFNDIVLDTLAEIRGMVAPRLPAEVAAKALEASSTSGPVSENLSGVASSPSWHYRHTHSSAVALVSNEKLTSPSEEIKQKAGTFIEM